MYFTQMLYITKNFSISLIQVLPENIGNSSSSFLNNFPCVRTQLFPTKNIPLQEWQD